MTNNEFPEKVWLSPNPITEEPSIEWFGVQCGEDDVCYIQHPKRKIITLCGSTKFKDEFLEAQKRLTLEGYIVLTVGLFGHSGDDEVWKDDMKEKLDDMHLEKIDMSDEVFVINVGGYIGESTKCEIDYALKGGKKVRYLEHKELHCYTYENKN